MVEQSDCQRCDQLLNEFRVAIERLAEARKALSPETATEKALEDVLAASQECERLSSESNDGHKVQTRQLPRSPRVGLYEGDSPDPGPKRTVISARSLPGRCNLPLS